MRLPTNAGRRRWRSQAKQPSKSPEAFRQRFLLLKVLILALFAVLTLQLVRMQVIEGESYRERAEHNRLRVLPVLPSRGLIYDRHGELLVKNEPSFAAAVVPADVPDDRFLTVVAELNSITGAPVEEIVAQVQRAQRSQERFTPVVVKSDLDRQTAFRLRERQSDLPGVQVVVESTRSYPTGQLTSHILGYTGRVDAEEYEQLKDAGYLMNDRLGKMGVEHSYEPILRGKPGYRQVETDALGREVQTIASKEPQAGANIVLSLDLDLQRKVTEYLQQAKNAGGSRTAAAVVTDVSTGEILAMSSLPAYDNNLFTTASDPNALQQLLNDPAKPLINQAIAGAHPPGSTFKQVTGSAALQEGVANVNTTITSYGSISVQNEYDPSQYQVFKDWQALGTMNFYRGLAMSSDVYFYYLSGGYYEGGRTVFRGLGAERLARYAREYGLGAPTGIDLPGEEAGIVPDAKWKEENVSEPWYLGDTYNFGIGQGYLTVTPLQLVRVTAAIANGGDVLTPHLLHEVTDKEGNVLHHAERQVAHHLSVSSENIDIMREAMRQAADYGPANTGQSRYVTIAAKTGTAEFGIRRPDGSYESHAWYAGYAPYDNPQIAIVVFLEKGIGATHGGPVARQIFDYYFSRQRLAQDEPAP